MATKALLIAVPLIPAAGIAGFIVSALRKGQLDMTLWQGFGTVSCYRRLSPRNFWFFIGVAGFIALALVGLALFFASAENSN